MHPTDAHPPFPDQQMLWTTAFSWWEGKGHAASRSLRYVHRTACLLAHYPCVAVSTCPARGAQLQTSRLHDHLRDDVGVHVGRRAPVFEVTVPSVSPSFKRLQLEGKGPLFGCLATRY